MITAKGDDSRVVFSISGNGNERFAGQRVITERRESGPVEERLVAILDLLNGIFVVVGRDGDVAAVDDLDARPKRVDIEGDVVASIQRQSA